MLRPRRAAICSRAETSQPAVGGSFCTASTAAWKPRSSRRLRSLPRSAPPSANRRPRRGCSGGSASSTSMRRAATTPTELIYRDWRHGDRIVAHPVGKDSWYLNRFGTPYYGIHRADLQRVLGTAFGSQGLHLG